MITIDTSDLLRLNGLLSAAQAKVGAQGHSATVKAVAAGKKYARDNVAVDTGETRSKIYGRTKGLEGEIGSPTRGAYYQELGTSRHPPQSAFVPAGELAVEVLGEGLQDAGALW